MFVVQHIVCHSIKGVARYVKRISQVRSRQASERRTENNGKQLKISDKRFNGLLGVIHSLQVEKLVVNGRLLPCFHDVVSVGCEQQALQPLSQAVVSARASRAVNHAHVCGIIVHFV